MGLLDDAIRQHLELKRRHGADPGEVAELEKEALGPVKRNEVVAVPSAEAPVDEFEVEDPGLEEPDDLEPLLDDEPAGPEPAEPEPMRAEPESGVHSLNAENRGDLRGPAPETVLADDEHAEEDVLEETPEFLQETPEHDRLWFEQKPPRDFDF